jgi:hypothetical protein
VTDVYYDEKIRQPVLDHMFEFKQELQDELGNVSGDWTMKPREPSFYKKLTKRNVPLPDGFFNSTQAE